MSKLIKRKSDKNPNQNTEELIMNAMDPLFTYIKPKDNDMFSRMRGIDLQDLLYYLENYYLELRNCLGFDDYITFGLELEFEHLKRKRRNKIEQLCSHNDWCLKRDDSLTKTNGLEITSSILKDTSSSWDALRKACYIINECATIGSRSGGHIYVGTQVIGGKPEAWLNFIKLWAVYENIIYRFAYGEFLTPRSSMSFYARQQAKDFWMDYEQFEKCIQLNTKDLVRKISHGKYRAVNFNNVDDFNTITNKNTIEFRCPNATLDPVIWQNNVNVFVSMLLYSKSSSYNDDVIQNRRNINEEKYSNIAWYDEIFLQQSLELCDLLFTNNLDKVYFLKQYLKSFEIGSNELSKSKPFTRTLKR